MGKRNGIATGSGVKPRLLRWLMENPDECLFFDDAAIKLGCRKRQVIQAVFELREEGLIESPKVIQLSPEAIRLLHRAGNTLHSRPCASHQQNPMPEARK